jgi:Ca2+-binding EF-hand superfamily protein
MIDADGSGTIDADELIEALQNEGVEVSRHDVNQILRSFARSAASVRQEAAQELLDAQKNKAMSSSDLAALNKPARQGSGASNMEEEEGGIDFPTFLDAMRHTNGSCDWCVFLM